MASVPNHPVDAALAPPKGGLASPVVEPEAGGGAGATLASPPSAAPAALPASSPARSMLDRVAQSAWVGFESGKEVA